VIDSLVIARAVRALSFSARICAADDGGAILLPSLGLPKRSYSTIDAASAVAHRFLPAAGYVSMQCALANGV